MTLIAPLRRLVRAWGAAVAFVGALVVVVLAAGLAVAAHRATNDKATVANGAVPTSTMRRPVDPAQQSSSSTTVSSQPPDSLGQSAAGSATPPVQSGAKPDDVALVLSVLVRQSELGPAWTATAGPQVKSDVPSSPATCLALPAPPHTAEASQSFSLDLQSNGRESGHFDDDVITHHSAPEAAARFDALTTSTRLMPCLSAEQEQNMRDSGGGMIVLSSNSAHRARLLPITGAAYRIETNYKIGDAGRPAVMYDDYVYLLAGRVRTILIFQRCSCAGGPLDDALENTVINEVAARMKAIPTA